MATAKKKAKKPSSTKFRVNFDCVVAAKNPQEAMTYFATQLAGFIEAETVPARGNSFSYRADETELKAEKWHRYNF